MYGKIKIIISIVFVSVIFLFIFFHTRSKNEEKEAVKVIKISQEFSSHFIQHSTFAKKYYEPRIVDLGKLFIVFSAPNENYLKSRVRVFDGPFFFALYDKKTLKMVGFHDYNVSSPYSGFSYLFFINLIECYEESISCPPNCIEWLKQAIKHDKQSGGYNDFTKYEIMDKNGNKAKCLDLKEFKQKAVKEKNWERKIFEFLHSFL